MQVIGSCFATTNVIDHLFPSVLYISAKYLDKPEAAMTLRYAAPSPECLFLKCQRIGCV